jgi:uncharacterized protein involved in tolerance to divalent cations
MLREVMRLALLLTGLLFWISASPSTDAEARGGRTDGSSPPSGRRPTTSDPRRVPASEPDLDDLLKLLGEKAAVYESIALRFVCLESARSSENSLNEKRYDYMYVEAEAQRYRPYRQRHSDKSNQESSSEVEVETDFPDSYSWTLIFAPSRQHLFHFKYGGQEWFSLRRAHIIEFTAPLPYTTGRTIYEWSGRIWVDAENYNFLKVEATPTNQDDRLKQLLRSYREAPRFLTFPMSHRPAGSRYEITFLNDYQKLSLPDQAEYRQFTLDIEGNAELTGFQIQRYSQYQFFGVQVQDKFLK